MSFVISDDKGYDCKPKCIDMFLFSFLNFTRGGMDPLVSLVLQFDQSSTCILLSYHSKWLEEEQDISWRGGVWMYALLAR